MSKKCNIFLCYRNDGAQFAKNFKLYADEISLDAKDERNFGKIWYSDFEVEGNFLDDKSLKQLIYSAKYFIVFLTKNFTNGFIKNGDEINEECATAKEIYYAELARKNRNLKMIFININQATFEKSDIDNLRVLFEQKGILSGNVINNYISYNRNFFNSRQQTDKEFFDRILVKIKQSKEDYKIVEFGAYPNELVTEPILYNCLCKLIVPMPTIHNLKSWQSFDYYYDGQESKYFLYKDIEYNNKKYRAILSFKLRPFITIGKKTYLDKIGVKANKIYFFEYKKIKWRVLSELENTEFLLANEVLDSQPINNSINDIKGIPANKYDYSTIKTWLNKKFYNWAFTLSEKKQIINNESISGVGSNQENRVFLISKDEVKKHLKYQKDRCLNKSDYASYQGVYESEFSDWFLRTEYEYSDTDTYYISGLDGSLKDDLVIYTNGGIVPAIIRRKSNNSCIK